jgi:hypothetical protein
MPPSFTIIRNKELPKSGARNRKKEATMPINIVQMVLSILLAMIGSTGLWNYISTRREKHDAKTKLLVGLAHDRIVYLGMKYIERGYITRDEYENLNDYLYVPYSAAGGNGSAKRVMEEVKRLPLHNI